MKLVSWLSEQKAHFLTLSKPERSLLLSFFLFGLASPIIYTYSNTFLWRQGQDPLTLIAFNAAFYAVIPIGFFLNTLAFKLTDSPRLYFLGSLMQGIVPFLLVFSNGSPALVPVFGALLGLAGGFYWANRNYLTSKISQGHHRFYFVSMEGALETIAAVVAPISIGWLLVMGEAWSLYSVDTAYRLAAVVTLMILFFAGRAVSTAGLPPCREEMEQVILKSPGKIWNRLRLMEVLNGFITGVEMILPTVIVLSVLGAEETIGTIESLIAVFSAIVLALLSRRVKHQHHLAILALWTLGALVGGLSFALFATVAGAITYFIVTGLTGTMRWSSLVTILYEIVDQHSDKGAAHRFVYIMDRELFLAIGRLTAIGLLFIFYTFNATLTTRFGLLLIVVAQFGLLLVAKPLLKHITHKPVPPTLDSQPHP